MWTNQFLKLFFVIFIGVEGVSGGISHVEDENLVIPKYISRLIQSQNLKVPSQNHDVALIGLEVKKEQKSEIFGQILGAILEENPENGVYTHQESSRIPKHRVDEVAFIIIVTDLFTFKDLFFSITKIFHSNPWTNSAKFIFVPVTQSVGYSSIKNVFRFFDAIGVTNAIFLRNSDDIFQVFSSKRFRKTIALVDHSKSELESAFPDKLLDLHGFKYKASIFHQPPKIQVLLNYVISVDLEVMKIFTDKQNAGILIYVITDVKQAILTTINLLRMRTVDLTFNTVIADIGGEPYSRFINSNFESKFCAMIPIPQRLSFLHFVFTHFDTISWILMAVMTFLSALVWKFSRRNLQTSSSVWEFIFNVVANFLAQSGQISEERQREAPKATFVFLLCVLMSFILGNAYQSLIVASMSSSREGARIETFQELFDSGMRLKVDPYFLFVYEASGDFKSIVDRMESNGENYDPNYLELARNNYAIIMKCEEVDYELNVQEEEDVGSLYYQLPEKIMPLNIKFALSLFSPFYEKIQEHFDFAFEAGIIKHWENKLYNKRLFSRYIREANYIKNESYLLTMQDLDGVFYVLLFGSFVSILVFLLEVFYHHSIELLTWCWKRLNRRTTENLNISTLKIFKRYKTKRVEVQPAAV